MEGSLWTWKLAFTTCEVLK